MRLEASAGWCWCWSTGPPWPTAGSTSGPAPWRSPWPTRWRSAARGSGRSPAARRWAEAWPARSGSPTPPWAEASSRSRFRRWASPRWSW